MSIHDWTRVSPGVFHDFHLSWIGEIKRALNSGVLPDDYYALAEQFAGDVGPDVLTLQANPPGDDRLSNPEFSDRGDVATAVVDHPPQVAVIATAEIDHYLLKQQTIVIRHSSDDRIVAFLEIISPGNKSSSRAFQKFREKSSVALRQGYHLLVVDLFPPTPRDPQGIHGAIRGQIIDSPPYLAPPDKRLTLAAYEADVCTTAYVQPISVGESLPLMPLFLKPGWYVNVPLNETYEQAWQSVPLRWRRELDPAAH